jgi:hypothetical protein
MPTLSEEYAEQCVVNGYEERVRSWDNPLHLFIKKSGSWYNIIDALGDEPYNIVHSFNCAANAIDATAILATDAVARQFAVPMTALDKVLHFTLSIASESEEQGLVRRGSKGQFLIRRGITDNCTEIMTYDGEHSYFTVATFYLPSNAVQFADILIRDWDGLAT